MLQGLTGWHFLIILAVILLLFGAAKLPALAKSMGQSARVFKGEMKAMKDEDTRPSGKTALGRNRPQREASVTPTTADAGRSRRYQVLTRAWPQPDRRASPIPTEPAARQAHVARPASGRAAQAPDVRGARRSSSAWWSRSSSPTAVIYLITEPLRADRARREGDAAKVELMFSTVTSGVRPAAADVVRDRPADLGADLAVADLGVHHARAHAQGDPLHDRLPRPRRSRSSSRAATSAWLVMPHIVELMATFVPDGGGARSTTPRTTTTSSSSCCIVVGVSFVLPVFLVALNLAGVMSGKAILKGWRVAVLVVDRLLRARDARRRRRVAC